MKLKLTTSAKVNIGLFVFETRPDGYHNIQSLFYPLNEANSNLKGDIIEIEDGCFCGAGKVRLLQSGITIGGNVSDNICVKAYNLLDREFDLPPVKIYLEKNVPIGAGLGGGSADGTYMLKSLNEKFNLSLSEKQLHQFAEKLGSDCPFFVSNQPAFVEGRGEKINREIAIPSLSILEHCYFKIVSNDVFVSTQRAYSLVSSRQLSDPANSLITKLQETPIDGWQGVIVNDFEEPIFNEFPSLRAIKTQLLEEGAFYVSMTGSGSAVFGIFKK